MRQIRIVIIAGTALALVMGAVPNADAQLTGSTPRVSVPDVTVPDTTTRGGRSTNSRTTEGTVANDEAIKKAEAEKARAEKIAADEKMRQEKIAAEKVRQEKLAAEKVRVETERVAKEKAEAERVRAEKAAADKAAAEKVRAEQAAKAEEARRAAEAEKVRAEKVRQEKIAADEKVRVEKEAAAKKAAEDQRIAQEKVRAEAERVAKEKAAAAERVRAEQAAKAEEARKAAEAEKVRAEKVRLEKIAAEEKVRQEKVAAEKVRAEAERVAKEKAAAAERVRAEQAAKAEEARKVAEAEKVRAEKVRLEKIAADEKVRVEKEAAAKKAAEEQRIAQEKVRAEQVAKAEEARKAAEAEKVRAEKVRLEKIAAEEKVRQEKVAAEKVRVEAERVAKEKAAAAERVRAEQAAKAEEARKAAEAEKVRTEKVRQEKIVADEKVRVEKEAAAKKAAEDQRIAQEKVRAEAERIAKEKAAAAEKVRAEQAEKAESARIAREVEAKAEAERAAREREIAKKAAEEQRLAQERADAARAAAERDAAKQAAEEHRLAREKLAAEKAAAERERAEKLAQIEAERKAREEAAPKVVREESKPKVDEEKKVERRVEDLPPIDPKKYREIEVTERRRTFIQEIDREIKDKDSGRKDTVATDSRVRDVAATDQIVRETEDSDSKVRCRNRDYFKTHLDECRIKSEQSNDDRRDAVALRAVRDSRCTSGDAVLQSKSSVFDVANAKVLDFPAGLSSKLKKPFVVESKESTLKQYIFIPIEENDRLDALIVDPAKGLVRIVRLGQFNDTHLLNDANGIADILVLSNASGVQFLPNLDAAIAAKMKDATPIEQLQTQIATDLIDPNSSDLKSITLPAGGQILTVHSYDQSLVLVRGDDKEKSAKDIVVLKSVSDAAPKTIPLNDLKGFMYRGAMLAPNGVQMEMAMVTMKNENSAMTTFHANDLLADTVVFEKIETSDTDQGNDKLKKITGKSEVKKSEKSIKTKVADKDKFEQMLADAMSAKKFTGVAVTHPFEDFGTISNAIVLKDAGFGFVKLGGAGIVEKEDELIVPQENGAACITSADAVAVDVDNAGGKDMAVLVENAEVASLVFYPNINQVQKFVSVTAEAKPEGIQLNQQSETEENETLKCHWEAFQKLSDGSLKDVSTQLSNPNVCNPIFKPASTEASKTSLINTINTLNLAAQWIADQVMPRAYAADSDSTEYIFRVTTTDPQGQQATAEATATVTKSATAPTASGGTSASSTANNATVENLVTVKVVNAEVLTPTQTETVATQVVDKGAQQTATSGTPTTIADVGMTAAAPANATTDTGATKSLETITTEAAPRGFAMEGGFGCALIRPTESASSAPMKVRAEVNEAPGFFARIRATIAKALNTTIATLGDFFQMLGGKVRTPGNDVTVTAKPEPIKIMAAPIVMSVSDAQRTLLTPSPIQVPAPVIAPPTIPDTRALSASMPSQPTVTAPSVEERVLSTIATPRSVINIQSSSTSSAATPTAPSPRPLGLSSSAAPASAPTSVGPPPAASMAPAPIASRDVLNLKGVEGPQPSEAMPSSLAAPASERPVSSTTAGAPLRSSAPQVAAAPSPTPASPVQSTAPLAPIATERPAAVTAERPVAAPLASPIQLPVTTFAPSAAPITGDRSAVASRPVVAEPAPVATRPAPADVAPAAPLAAELPEARPATIAVRPEVSCNDLSFVMANRATCRCAVRDSSLGNILPLAEAERGTPHAVSIQNGKVVFNPSLFLRDALNCPVDPALPQPIVPSFELPQPRVRGAERDLLVANVFVTPEGRIFGIAVDDAEGHRIRGIASWDVGPSAAATILSFKQFPEFLQLNETIRGMMVTKDERTGRNVFDITFINRSGTQVPYHCDLSRDDVLTCTEPEPVRQ